MAEPASTQDIYSLGLDMMLAALEPREKSDATAAVRALADAMDSDVLVRVATMLAVECVRTVRPRRSKRELRDWIDRQRFAVLMHGWGSDDV